MIDLAKLGPLPELPPPARSCDLDMGQPGADAHYPRTRGHRRADGGVYVEPRLLDFRYGFGEGVFADELGRRR